MVALKRVNGALVRVSEGIEMEALVRVNGGWSGSMGVLKRINAGIGQVEKGQGSIGQGQCGY